MKTKLFTFLVFAICVNTHAQIILERHVITNEAAGASSVYSIDIDSDGILDVISASENDNKIAWYKNDGNGNFGAQQIITESALGAMSVYAADIDGDTDMDVLSASFSDDTISWYENIDGQGEFVEHIITTDADGARSVYSEDLDEDGDMDVLSASFLDGKITWYENVDGLGTFVDHIITIHAYYPTSVSVADLDNDGDMDVLSTSWVGYRLFWYENLGGDFGDINTNQQLISAAGLNHAISVSTADFDDDDNIDVLTASYDDDKIAWYKNLEDGDFGDVYTNQNILSENIDGARSAIATDFDGDGDMDVLSASYHNSKISLFENTDGLGSFNHEQILTTEAWRTYSIYAANIDGDENMDVLSANWLANEISWYKQVTLGVDENALPVFSVYPSPTTGMLTIESQTPITEIEIYNQLGQLVLSNSNKNTIDLSSVNQGIYFIKIKDENGNIGTQKVVKK